AGLSFSVSAAVRVRLVPSPRAPHQAVSLPLARAADLHDPYLVFIGRVRNVGTEPVRIAARVGGQILAERPLAPGSSARLDLVWPRPVSVDGSYQIELAGTTGHWRVEYAELANMHGFTRGAVE